MNHNELIELLNKDNIQTDEWIKTPLMLLDEIKEGSSILIKKDGELLRQVFVAVIFCVDDKLKYFVEKDKFILTEKILKNEKPIEGCKRGLAEELGLIYKKDYKKILKLGKHEEKKDSYSYKGLVSHYKYYAFFVKTNREPQLLNIDHDGKKLEFIKIDLNDFKMPNSFFIKKLKVI